MLRDILEKYRQTFEIIEFTANPKTQLVSIIEFFESCDKLHLAHLHKQFLPDFINPLINIFKHSTISFINPRLFQASKFLLIEALDLVENEIIINEISSILDLLNLRLLLLYYYLGEAENGKVILEDIIHSDSVTSAGVSLEYFGDFNTTAKSKNLSLADPGLFKVSKVFDILRQIKYELDRVNSFSSNEVNILLVESDNSGLNFRDFGMVQGLECRIEKNRTFSKDNPIIENIIDINEEGIHEIKAELIKSSDLILSIFNTRLQTHNDLIALRFKDLRGIYKGTSFGFGAAILIPSAFLEFKHSRTRYEISGSAAFTGSLDGSGNLIKLHHSSIAVKVEAAFYSWIKNIAVPEDNYQDAVSVLDTLHRSYPRKELNIIPIKNIKDLLENSSIIKKQKDSLYEFSGKLLKRNQIFTYSALTIVMVLLTSLLVWTFVPRNVKPLPQTQSYLNIFYTPDRDTSWIFTNSDRAGGDTLIFGEIGIGDMLTHRIALWNNSNEKQKIRIELSGENKDEFEVLWGVDQMQREAPEKLTQNERQRVYIKFIPWRQPGEKNAIATFYSLSKPSEKKTVYLKGKSEFFRNGYSLRLRNDDEYVINPKQGNFLREQFTIMFWFKPNIANLSLLNDENSNWSDTKFSISIDYDSTASIYILESGAMQTYSNRIKSKQKVSFNQWNSIAVSHKNNVTSLFLNDEKNTLITENEHLKQIEDLFYLGAGIHPSQRGLYDYRKDGWELILSEVKIFKIALSDNEIKLELNKQSSYSDNKLILYHNFEESVGHFIHDMSRNDIPGDLFGLPEKVLDYPPVERIFRTKTVSKGNDNYVKIHNKGEIRLNKNIFPSKSSFTIQFDAKTGGNLKKNWRQLYQISGITYNYSFTYVDGDSICISRDDHVNDNSLMLSHAPLKLDDNWHKYTLDYSLEKNTGRLFIDGKLLREYSMGKYDYDISRQFFFMIFGKEGQFDNPRFYGEESSIDNVAIFKRILSEDEIKMNDPSQISSITGLLALWTFSEISNNVCFDEVSRIPVFIWEEYEILQK